MDLETHMSKQNEAFFWLCNHDRLPTCHYLNTIGIEMSPNCYYCGQLKTTKHIFIYYNKVKKYWRKLKLENFIALSQMNEKHWLYTLFTTQNT